MIKVFELVTQTAYSKRDLQFDTVVLVDRHPRRIKKLIARSGQLITNTVCEFYIKSELDSWIREGGVLYCKLEFKITGKRLKLLTLDYHCDYEKVVQ